MWYIISFVICVVSLWFGAHYGIDMCSDDVENTTILKHIKKDVLRSSEMSDECKLQYLKVLKEQLKSISI